MIIKKSQIIQIIREELLNEIPGEIIDPGQGSGAVPVTKDSQIGRASTDTAARQSSYMTSSTGRDALEIILGTAIPPVGFAIDTSYLAWAVYNKDAEGAVWAGIGFLPFAGDALRGLRKQLTKGNKLSMGQKMAVDDAIDKVRREDPGLEGLKKKAERSSSSARAAFKIQAKAADAASGSASVRFLPAGTIKPDHAGMWISAKLSKPGYMILYRGQKNQHMNIAKNLTDEDADRFKFLYGKMSNKEITKAEKAELEKLFYRMESGENFFADSAENAAKYAGENGTVYGVRIPKEDLIDYLAPRGFTQGGGTANFVISGEDLMRFKESGDMVGTGPVRIIE